LGNFQKIVFDLEAAGILSKSVSTNIMLNGTSKDKARKLLYAIEKGGVRKQEENDKVNDYLNSAYC